MVKVIQQKNVIRVGKEPVVILSLREWRKVEKSLEDLEESLRFNVAYKETRGKKMTSLESLKKKYKL